MSGAGAPNDTIWRSTPAASSIRPASPSRTQGSSNATILRPLAASRATTRRLNRGTTSEQSAERGAGYRSSREGGRDATVRRGRASLRPQVRDPVSFGCDAWRMLRGADSGGSRPAFDRGGAASAGAGYGCLSGVGPPIMSACPGRVCTPSPAAALAGGGARRARSDPELAGGGRQSPIRRSSARGSRGRKAPAGTLSPFGRRGPPRSATGPWWDVDRIAAWALYP